MSRPTNSRISRPPRSARLARSDPLHPPPRALEIAQDRLAEKKFVVALGGRPAPFAAVDDRAALDAALAEIGAPAILKTRRFGYDGKGQARIEAPRTRRETAWAAVSGAPRILEGFVAFDAEFSILLCRGADGTTAIWDAPRNIHSERHPGPLDRPGRARRSRQPSPRREALSRRIAEALDHVGMLAVEYFAVGDEAMFNEMAPRVHNSGHWTIEGAATSQFENHIRAICGLPLGATDADRATRRDAQPDRRRVDDWPAILAEPGAHLHHYGKRNARPGRKMGHVTRLIGRRTDDRAGRRSGPQLP